jgi:hypothetical protein
MNPMILLDNAVTSQFVSPHKCVHLYEMGLTTQVMYGWKIKSDYDFFPFTYAYDTDSYYKDSDALINELKDYRTAPAYRISDLEPLFGSYNLTKKDPFTYKLCFTVGERYDEEVHAPRLPDLFALALQKAVHKNYFKVIQLNAIIESKNKN